MAYYLGLDAGGTKTECALAREDTILARAAAGSIKIMRTSAEEAGRNLDAVLREVSVQSGVSLGSIACSCIGLSGHGVPRIADWTRAALHARVGGAVLLAGDEEIALDAAFRGAAGVLVVAGTGSNTIGRSTTGQLIHVGGWGPVLADEGSGDWIGKQAVRAIFDALDHGETTLLLDKVLDDWGLADVGGLIDIANQLPGPNFSRLAPLVVECAGPDGQQDRYASRVLQQAGTALGMFAALTARRVQAIEPKPVGYPEIAFTGSILRHVGLARDAMCKEIRRTLPQVQIQDEAADPLEGALWRARQSSPSSGC